MMALLVTEYIEDENSAGLQGVRNDTLLIEEHGQSIK